MTQHRARFWLGVGAVILPTLFIWVAWSVPTGQEFNALPGAVQVFFLIGAVVTIIGAMYCWGAGLSE
jgi:hypothetical protein